MSDRYATLDLQVVKHCAYLMCGRRITPDDERCPDCQRIVDAEAQAKQFHADRDELTRIRSQYR